MAEQGHQADRKMTGEQRGVGRAVEREREEEAGGKGQQVPSGSRRGRGEGEMR